MRPIFAQIAIVVGFGLVAIASSVGCKTESSSPSTTAPALSKSSTLLPAASPPTPQPTVSGAPIPKAQVEAAVNPTKAPPYEGPTGIIEGTVRMSGDQPPDVPLNVPPECMGAAGTYGRLFREGKNRAAADVLVAVTGFDGYVPEKEEAVEVTIDQCAYSTRTVAMTYGQRMEVKNLDARNSYIPILQGSRYTAYMVAVPKGSPVRLYPHRVGQYQLTDNMNRPWMSADTFVLKFATHDVTDMDGHFRVEGVPVGEVMVNALLPAASLTEGKKVKVTEGKTTKVDFVLAFDMKKHEEKMRPSPSASVPVPKVPLVK